MNSGSKLLRGFTFAETLVTMAVLVLFIGSAVGLSVVAQANQTRNEREQLKLTERLSIMSVLPRICSSVRPPVWASAAMTFEVDGASFVAHYWEGQGPKSVRFEVHERRLSVTTPEARWDWGRAELGRLAWWTRDGRVVGLKFSWADTPDDWVHVPWGGLPL